MSTPAPKVRNELARRAAVAAVRTALITASKRLSGSRVLCP